VRLEISPIATFECIKEISYVAGFVLSRGKDENVFKIIAEIPEA